MKTIDFDFSKNEELDEIIIMNYNAKYFSFV